MVSADIPTGDLFEDTRPPLARRHGLPNPFDLHPSILRNSILRIYLDAAICDEHVSMAGGSFRSPSAPW